MSSPPPSVLTSTLEGMTDEQIRGMAESYLDLLRQMLEALEECDTGHGFFSWSGRGFNITGHPPDDLAARLRSATVLAALDATTPDTADPADGLSDLATEWERVAADDETSDDPFRRGYDSALRGCAVALRRVAARLRPTQQAATGGSWACGRCGGAPEQHAHSDCVYDPVFRTQQEAADRVTEAVEALADYFAQGTLPVPSWHGSQVAAKLRAAVAAARDGEPT